MSVPYHLLAGLDMPYSHTKFLKCEVRNVKGMLESICRGNNDHAQLLPKDMTNLQYLDSFARQISYLKEEVDT